jgi:hypothetical protein
MGIKTAESSDQGNAIVTARITVGNKAPFNVVLVAYPRAEMLDPEHFRKKAQNSIHSY